MVQPVRPQDASNVYRQQAASTARPGGGTPAAGGDAGAPRGPQRGRRADQVTLSDEGRQLRRVLDAMAQLPEVRAQRVAFLQQQIADGTYDRGITAVARRLVEEGFVS